MRKIKFFSLLAGLFIATTSLWADPAVAVNGKLPGAFSVSATKQVYFSQGNLQYKASTNTWRFAEHQYDFIGNAAGNNTDEANRATQSDWIDLFGWATSGNSSSGTAYQPYATITKHDDYGSSISSGEWTAANSDWGVVSSASIGSGWRTLTKDEWDYLFKTRTTSATVNSTANARYTEAKILTDGSGTENQTYNICGMILFPDDFDGSKTYSGVSWGTVNYFDQWSTTCTTAGWAALEEAGCVFLPAAGNRHGMTMYQVGEDGNYWSSTAESASYAYFLYFNRAHVRPIVSDFRDFGKSVRLVSNVPPTTPSAKTDAEVTTPPTAVNRSYDASTQALITAGTATGGTMKYSLTSGSGYSTDLPTAKNAGTYTVYYMVEGDATHNDVAEASVEVTISKVGLTVTAEDKDVTCGDAAPAYTATYNGFVGGETEAVLGGTLAFACDYTTSSAAGDYTITPSGLTSDNYTITFQTGTLTATAAAPVVVTIDVPTHQDPLNSQWYYTTFYHGTQNYALTNDATEAFVADLSGTDLVLTKIAEGEQVIPANTGVIFRKSYSADPVVLAPTDAAGVSFTANNDLKGVDVQTDLTAIDGLTAANCYILSGQADDHSVVGVGFYKVNKTYLKEHKAYVKYVGNPSSAPKRMRFVFEQENTATGMESIQPSDVSCQKVLRDGQLIILRNGVEYNANGQIVK